MRVGVVGCGFFARFHIQAWKDLAAEGAELVAVADIDATKAERVAAEFGISRWYADPARMLGECDLGLVDIATRMDTHRALVELALHHRVPIVVQKPLAPDWTEAVAIVDAARQAGLFLAVHENFRFQAPMRAIAALITEGAIGAPTWARISFRTDPRVYESQPYFLTEKRLVILDVGIHMLDLARVLVGEVEHVSCETQRRNPAVRAEDTATMLLRHVSGAVSVVECTYENRRLPGSGVQTLVEIEGPEGAIVLDRDFRLSLTSHGRHEVRDVSPPPLAWADPGLHVVQESVLQTCRHMLGAVSGGSPAATSGEDNLRTFALVEAAYRAAEEHRSIRPQL
jgi:predicted dehydrogenase